MEVHSLLEGLGWLSAPVLGLLVALDPCTLAASITAVGYISGGRGGSRVLRSSLFYALGRTLTYSVLLFLLQLLLQGGMSVSVVSDRLVRWGGGLIGPALILLGLLLLLVRYVPMRSVRFDTSRLQRLLARQEVLGAFLLGMLFSLAICPSIALLFFGFLVPQVVAQPVGGWFSLVLFGLFTALPVVLLGWLMSYGIERVGSYYRVLGRMQRWLSMAMAVLFIVAGLQMLLESRLGDHHHGSSPLQYECKEDCPSHTG